MGGDKRHVMLPMIKQGGNTYPHHLTIYATGGKLNNKFQSKQVFANAWARVGTSPPPPPHL